MTCERCGYPSPNQPIDDFSCWPCIQDSVKDKKPVVTAIIVDPVGVISMDTTPEDEIQELTKRYTAFVGHPLDVYTPAMFYESEIRIGTELVLFDYGGMAFGNSLLDDNSRRLVAWAVDHPNALVVVTSTFSFSNGVQLELKERGMVAAAPADPVSGPPQDFEGGPRVAWNIACETGLEGAKCIPDWWKAGLK